MAVAATTSSTSTASSTSTQTGAATKSLLTNYDTFLKLLTTQLRVQNPLEPMDAEKFTEQLVQYSAVEQQIQTNQNLESMLAAMVSSAALGLVNYIGKTVEATSDTTQMADGKAVWKMSAAADAPTTTVTILNEAGAVVHTDTIELTAGENTYTWDGKTADGQTFTEGTYQIALSASDAEGAGVAVVTRTTGEVTSVDTSGSEPYLEVNGVLVPLSNLLGIRS